MAGDSNAATNTGSPDANGQFGAAADDFDNKFMDALGFEANWLGYRGFFTEDGFREKLSEKAPNEVLDAFAEADPSTASLMAKMKEHPELATAFHKALVQDESMLAGLQQMRDPNSSEISMADIEETLKHPQAVTTVTNLLEAVADGSTVPGTDTDISFQHVQETLSAYKKDGVSGAVMAMQQNGVDIGAGEMSSEVMMQFFNDLMVDPSMAVNNLMETMVEYGQMDLEQANMLKGFMEPFAGFAKFAAEPYVEYAQKYGLTPGKIGETIAGAKESAQEAGEGLGETYGTGNGANIYGGRDMDSYRAAIESAQAQTDQGASADQTGADHTETAGLTDTNAFQGPASGTQDVTQDPAFGGTDPQVAAGAKPATLDAA